MSRVEVKEMGEKSVSWVRRMRVKELDEKSESEGDE